jgi:Protein tyrosine and serine/threonine kinase/Leucine rich repeat/Leucine Rich repeats (2 copies)
MNPQTLQDLRSGRLRGTTRLDLSCGLTEFPREIFELEDSLEILNLSGNQLTSLPDDLSRLKRLRILFCSQNDFTHVPAVLGDCPSLTMVGFKANRIRSVDAAAFPQFLQWLILTDNRIHQLPDSIGKCSRLQKCMLSGNELAELPEAMVACENLELLRLAANRFESLPEWLLALPKLAWLAVAGNPWSAAVAPDFQTLKGVHWSRLELLEKLGEGASGIVHKAVWKPHDEADPQHVAVKIFKGAMTSDGLPECELSASLAVGQHPHLVEALGRVIAHPSDLSGLVMTLMDPEFKSLAGPPSFATCTRDVYAEGLTFSLPVILKMAVGLASAGQRLHERGIMHGDFYAHNVTWKVDGDCLLGDFGGASFYPQSHAVTAAALQKIEVRAFGYLLEELLERHDEREKNAALRDSLLALKNRCLLPRVPDRPDFTEIATVLASLARG